MTQQQFSSVAQSCLNFCGPIDFSKPGFPVHHQLSEFTQIHVHCVSDAIQPYHLLPSPSPSAFISPSIMVSSKSHFSSGSQSFQVSASAPVLLVNIQEWFPLGLTDLISLLSKGLSCVFSSTTFKSIISLACSLVYGPNITPIHDYWKNHSFY